MKKAYLDYAATTPVDARVMRAMEPYFNGKFGNPGSLHSFGQEAIAAVDRSRETIAKAIVAPPAGGFREIIFTGSATEANNMALRGAVRAYQRIANPVRMNEFVNSKKIRYSLMKPRIIVSATEHESVLETAKDLEKDGVEVVIIPVTKQGIVDLKKLEAALNERTVLVSVMYANNEIGTVQPISKIVEIVRNFRSTKHEARNPKQYLNSRSQNLTTVSNFDIRISDFGKVYPLFHVDAVQAFQFLDCDVDALGVDLMTLSAHKIYGPKGIGGLYVRQQIANSKSQIVRNGRLAIGDWRLVPVVTGGGQEFGLRSGTENVPSIVGFAEAVRLAAAMREKESARIHALSRYFLTGIKKIKPDARLNGVPITSKLSPERLPNVINVCLPGLPAQDALTYLDLRGVAVSSGSACSARSNAPSHVLTAIGCSEAQAKSSIRVSLGRMTTRAEIDRALKVIRELVHI